MRYFIVQIVGVANLCKALFLNKILTTMAIPLLSLDYFRQKKYNEFYC